jgi:hypothetical protein
MLLRHTVLASAIALTAVLAAPSRAEEGKTRAQVRAELAEAIRTGDILADGFTGQKLNERYPTSYPRPAGATRGAANDRDAVPSAVDTANAARAAVTRRQPEGAATN